MTIVVEGQRMKQFPENFVAESQNESRIAINHLSECLSGTSISCLSASRNLENYKIISLKPEVTSKLASERELCTIQALASLSVSPSMNASVQKFGYAFLMHTAALNVLSLEKRRLPDVEFMEGAASDNKKFKEFLNAICKCMTAITNASRNGATAPESFKSDVYDILDGRLFKYI